MWRGYKEILDFVGHDAYYKGSRCPSWYVEHQKTEELKDRFIHYYTVDSFTSRKKYKVTIQNNGTKLMVKSCTCKAFALDKTCKHIAGVLCNYPEEIMNCYIVNELEASKELLNDFIDKKKNNVIKEKIKVEYEIDITRNIEVKVSLGLKRLYSLNTQTKFDDVTKAIFNNGKYELGKSFTLDMDIHYIDAKDLEILKYLASTTNRVYSCVNALNIREFNTLVNMLSGTPFSIRNIGRVDNVYHQMPSTILLSKENGNYIVNIENMNDFKYLSEDIIYFNNALYYLNDKETKLLSLILKKRLKRIVFSENEIDNFTSGLFKTIKPVLQISPEVENLCLPNIVKTKLYLDISDYLECTLKFDYGKEEINYFDKVSILRDVDKENEIVSDLLSYGFVIEKNKFVIDSEDETYYFIEDSLEELSSKYDVYTSKKINDTNIIKKTTSVNNFSIGKDGILSYDFSIDEIDANELGSVFKALKSKKRYYKLKNNNVISLENNENLIELNNLIEELNVTDIDSGHAEVPKYRALYIDSLKANNKSIKTNNLFNEFIDNFKKYQNVEMNFSKFDIDTLRDYQKAGVKWLYTIYKCGFGGILADEMGLGKSIQTISFIKEVLKENPKAKIIIVTPTSLVYNWEREFEKFGSDLKYTVVAENKAKRLDILKHLEEYNIFITTYGLIRNDKDEYENIDFEVCIIDEGQMIKNYQANMTKEVKKIKSKCKIALTGTPVENNVSELWSIFDYIMPGYLNSIIKFKEKYNIKDVMDDDIKKLKNLNYLIAPFILRRKKADVIESLPDKIENNIYLDLPKVQKMLYLKVLNDTKKEIDELVKNGGFQKSRFKIINLLTELRQICIDPSIKYDNYAGEKIKIEELVNIVNANKGEHKILIFSSFKRALNNVKKAFEENNISYYSIDGDVKSKDRLQMVEQFNADDTNCFLITLKAGGTGLNLTGADIVIHLDIWWNPHVENQATDRAHRIGQTKKVSVYKLVTKGTIEERIIELQQKKKILSDNLIEGNTSSESLSSLSEKDIKKLLSISGDENENT